MDIIIYNLQKKYVQIIMNLIISYENKINIKNKNRNQNKYYLIKNI